MTEEELLNSPFALEQAEKSKKKALKTAAKLKPSKKVWAVIGDLEYLTPKTIAILIQRGQEFHDNNRLGEPRPCRRDGWQFVIHSNQVQALFNIHIRTAQDVLSAIRKALGKGKNNYVTVNEFCDLNKLPEDETREALKRIKPDFKIK
jgi:hypothetical protein